MRDMDAIKARLRELPSRELSTCCPDGLVGTGMSDANGYGPRIADAVLEPYADFFVKAPTDIHRLIEHVEKLEAALKCTLADYECQGVDCAFGPTCHIVIARTALAEEEPQ